MKLKKIKRKRPYVKILYVPDLETSIREIVFLSETPILTNAGKDGSTISYIGPFRTNAGAELVEKSYPGKYPTVTAAEKAVARLGLTMKEKTCA